MLISAFRNDNLSEMFFSQRMYTLIVVDDSQSLRFYNFEDPGIFEVYGSWSEALDHWRSIQKVNFSFSTNG